MNDKDIDKIMKELLKVTKRMPMPVVTEIKLVTNRDAYKILISTMLSLRTKDSTTRDASMRLFEKAGNPKDMLKLSEEEIAKLIYPVGFYRVKAKNILEVSKTIIDDYNGKVPDGILPIRDIISTSYCYYYQTYAITSPPRPSLRACLSLITPLDVEITAIPKPPSTRGSSSFFA